MGTNYHLLIYLDFSFSPEFWKFFFVKALILQALNMVKSTWSLTVEFCQRCLCWCSVDITTNNSDSCWIEKMTKSKEVALPKEPEGFAGDTQPNSSFFGTLYVKGVWLMDSMNWYNIAVCWDVKGTLANMDHKKWRSFGNRERKFLVLNIYLVNLFPLFLSLNLLMSNILFHYF